MKGKLVTVKASLFYIYKIPLVKKVKYLIFIKYPSIHSFIGALSIPTIIKGILLYLKSINK